MSTVLSFVFSFLSQEAFQEIMLFECGKSCCFIQKVSRDTGNADGNSDWGIFTENICFWENTSGRLNISVDNVINLQEKPTTRGWCNGTLPLPQASELSDWCRQSEKCEETRRSEVSQTEPDKSQSGSNTFCTFQLLHAAVHLHFKGEFRENASSWMSECLSLTLLQNFPLSVFDLSILTF